MQVCLRVVRQVGGALEGQWCFGMDGCTCVGKGKVSVSGLLTLARSMLRGMLSLSVRFKDRTMTGYFTISHYKHMIHDGMETE